VQLAQTAVVELKPHENQDSLMVHMGPIKEIEVTYGLKRPIAKFSSENISATLAKDVEVKDEEELEKEVHGTLAKARKFVETERWITDQFGTGKAPTK